jgi:hypothetical protein
MNNRNYRNIKKQMNIRLEYDLHDFLVRYANENYTTVTAVIRGLVANLYKEYSRPALVRRK